MMESHPASRLHALFTRAWDWELEEQPTWASELGDRRWNDRWPDLRLDAFERRREIRAGHLAELRAIPRDSLSEDDRLSYDLFGKQWTDAIEEHDHRFFLLPMDMRSGPHSAYELADALRFEEPGDFTDWNARLSTYPQYVEENIALMREGMRAGRMHPKIVIQRLPAQIGKEIHEEPEQSAFFAPFLSPTASHVAAAARDNVARRVFPALQRLREFVEKEYLPACLDEVGVHRLPDGDALYAFYARFHTTTSRTPQQIHDTGLREVARIRDEMESVRTKVGHSGSLQEFFTFLRSDPRFYYPTPAALLEGYRAMAKRIDPQLLKLFRNLPRTPYGVEPIPDAAAPDTTTAYYRPPAADGSRAGTYFVNLYRPETRAKWEMMALSLHEAVPGHHLQISRAMELPALPEFRKHGRYTAYVEGWALYAESLGEEMGLYDDPYAKFGQLTYEMWRAVRLVVDTGIHALGWDRQRAIEFFADHAPKAELDIINEIDRYIAWPGQALAYKVGELEFQALRARATRELGPRFDVRTFHDVVLERGAVPLSILGGLVEDWITRTRA